MTTMCDNCGTAPSEIDTASGRHLCLSCSIALATRPLWAVHHADREHARATGDPVLGYVRASSKDEAERNASHLATGAGVWAVEVEPLGGRRAVGGY